MSARIGAHQGSLTSCDPGSSSAALPPVIDGRYGVCCWCFATAPQEAAVTVYFERISLVLADWMIAMATSRVEQPPAPKDPASRPTGGARIGWIVAGSLATGLVAAPALSPPRSSRPRRAPSPARCCAGSRWAGRCWRCSRCGSPTSPSGGPRFRPLFMGLGGLLLVAVRLLGARVLDWVWPPALLALAIWMFVRARRRASQPRADAGCSTR